MSDTGFFDAEAAQAAQLRALRRRHRAQFWRSGWADAKTGPLPMAHFLVSAWRRVTHKAHPSYLLLSALSAANEAIAQRLPDPDDFPSLSAAQKLRLGLLRWLIGDKDIGDEASALVVFPLVLSSTSSRNELAGEPASRPRHPIVRSTLPPIRPDRRSGLRSGALPDRSGPLPVAGQSPATSSDSHPDPTLPPLAADDGAQPATTGPDTHRLSGDAK